MLRNEKGFTPLSLTKSQDAIIMNERTSRYFSKSVDFDRVTREKSPAANLKLKHPKALEVSMIVALVLLTACFQAVKWIPLGAHTIRTVDVQIEVADIPPTDQFRKPPPPERPSIPIPSDDEMIPEDLTIATTDIDMSDIPAPPPPPVDVDDAIFIAYDEPPQIIGGMQELLKHIKYPRIAHAANIEGLVFVKVLVGPTGETEKVEVLKAKPARIGFEKSAIDAVKKVRWQPAKQRDRNIRVWISIPVQFKLVSS